MRPTKRGWKLTPRSEAGLTLAEHGAATQVISKVYEVESADGQHSYVVTLDPIGCSCPDWRYRGQKTGAECKHIIAAVLQYLGC